MSVLLEQFLEGLGMVCEACGDDALTLALIGGHVLCMNCATNAKGAACAH